MRRLPSIPTKHLDAFSHCLLATCDVLPRPVDIVHYHALGPALLAGLPRWLAHKATIVTVHGLDWQREKWGPLASWILKKCEYPAVHFPDRRFHGLRPRDCPAGRGDRPVRARRELARMRRRTRP